jgi:prolyl 4-hydroxylase
MHSVPKRIWMWLSAVVLLLSTSLPLIVGDENSYGADVSWPIQHPWTNKSKPLNTERKIAYERFMDGCRKKNEANAGHCDANENLRLDLSLSQPQSMVNFTSTGFKKIRAPEALRKLLSENWERNKDDKMDEAWTSTDIYTNHWDDPAYLVPLKNMLKQEIWNYAKEVIEQWTGMELRPISLYGIRVYTEGKVTTTLLDYCATGLF